MTILEKIKILGESMPQFGRFAGMELTAAQNEEIERIYNFYSAELPLQQKLLLRKKEQRVLFRKRRDALPKTLLDTYAVQAAEKISNLPEYKKSRLVFIPISFGSELPTSVLISQALKDSKRVAVPAVRGENMLLQEITARTTYHKAAFGILEPDSEHFITEIPDFTFLPALAFSCLGFRVGYGGGYYDRFLAGYTGISVGVCMPEFTISIIPEKWDYPADIMLFL